MSDAQWTVVRRVLDFYAKAAPVIRHGFTRRYGPELSSWRHPKGWQAIVREGGENVLCVVHTFHEAPGVVRFPIPEGYRVAEGCAREGIVWAQTDRTVIVSGLRELDGMALLLDRI